MRIRRVKLPRPAEQLVDLLHFGRRDIGITSQRLHDEPVSLHLIDDLLALKRQCLHLLGGMCGGQGLICGIELLAKLIGLGLQ